MAARYQSAAAAAATRTRSSFLGSSRFSATGVSVAVHQRDPSSSSSYSRDAACHANSYSLL